MQPVSDDTALLTLIMIHLRIQPEGEHAAKASSRRRVLVDCAFNSGIPDLAVVVKYALDFALAFEAEVVVHGPSNKSSITGSLGHACKETYHSQPSERFGTLDISLRTSPL